MKLRSRNKAIGASIATLILAGVIAVGATEFKTTDQAIENDTTINQTAVLAEEDEQTVLSVEPVSKDLVMGTISDVLTTEEAKEPETEAAEEPKSEYADKFMANIEGEECLNIRAQADENAEIVGKLYAGAGGTVLEKGDQWTKVSSGNVEGYVASAYLLFGDDAKKKADETGKILIAMKEDCIRIRKEPKEEAEVVGLAEAGRDYTAVNILDGWMEIQFEDGTGFVSSQFSDARLVIGKAISIEEEQEQIRAAEEKKRQEEEARKQQEAAAAREEEEDNGSGSQSVQTVQTAGYDADYDDTYLLACLVEAEAGNEPYEGMLAVANVVLNRVNSPSFGSSIEEVIYARGQFSVVNNGSLNRALSNGPSGACMQAAQEALAGVNNVPNYYFFRMTYIANYSRYNSYSIIGSQVFYN